MIAKRQSALRTVCIVSSGNFLEMYNFLVFGYYATAIAKTFFPSSSDYTALMLSLMTFGAGSLMRPLGALLLGTYVDRHGRRAGLILTLGLMAVGTLSVACMPGYVTLGVFAPVMVLLGRLLQGFSAGAEVGGVSVYLAEIATPGHRGFYVSWQSASQQVAVVLAAAGGMFLAVHISPAAMIEWGWRIPLGLGCVLVPVIFVLRRSLQETDEFLARRRHPTRTEVFETVGKNWRIVLLGVMLATMTTVSFYFVTAYTPTFGNAVLKLAPRDNLLVTLCVGVCNFVCLPISGAVSDRIGRRPLLITCSLLMLLTGYPVLSWLVGAPSLHRLFAADLWLAVLYAWYNGAMIVFVTEIMPAHVRTTGFSLVYALATALFGTFTPAICTYLIHLTGDHAMPGIWLSIAAAMGLTAALILSGPQWQSEELPADVPAALPLDRVTDLR